MKNEITVVVNGIDYVEKQVDNKTGYSPKPKDYFTISRDKVCGDMSYTDRVFQCLTPNELTIECFIVAPLPVGRHCRGIQYISRDRHDFASAENFILKDKE